MAIAFRASATATTHLTAASSMTQTCNKPTGTVSGDVMVMVVEQYYQGSNNWSSTPPSGWNTLADGFGIALLVKTAGASEPSSYTFSATGDSGAFYDGVMTILSYSGAPAWVDGGQGVNWNLTQSASATTTSVAPGTISTPGAADVVVNIYAELRTGGAQGTISTPSGWTSRAAIASTGTGGSVGTAGLRAVDKLAATDKPTVTHSTAALWAIWNVILGNQAPTASAGADQSKFEGSNVTLSGSGSDPEGGTLTYAWTVTNDGGTGLTTGNLTGANTATPSFTAPSVVSNSNITLTLTVTDPGGLTGTDTVVVTVKPPNVLLNLTGSGGLLVGGGAVISARLINILLNLTGSGGVLVGSTTVIDPSLINILLNLTMSGGAVGGGTAEFQFVQEIVQPVEVFQTTPSFEVSLAARTPAASGAPTLVEVDRLVVDSIQYTDELNKPGSATLGVAVRSLSDAVKVRLANLAAHPCEVWIYYDSELVWAGEVQTIAIQDQTIQLGCVGLLGYMYRMGIIKDYTFTAEDPLVIVKTLIDDWQNQTYGNFGIDTSDIGTSDVNRDQTYLRNDLSNAGQRIEELTGAAGGFDLHVDPATRKLILSHPKRGIDRTQTVVLDERSIDSPQIAMSIGPEDLVSNVYVNGTTLGASGESVPLYTEVVTPWLWATYGRSWGSFTVDGVMDQDTLNAHGIEYATARSTQLLQPGATLFARPGTSPGDFSPGDTVAYAFDAGLGTQAGSYRVSSVMVAVDGTGSLRLTVEFT